MVSFKKTRIQKNCIYLLIGFMKNNLINQDVHAFFKMAPETREKRLSVLPLEEQLTLVLFAPWEKRHEIITSSPRARELVQALPPEELFWTVKATGPGDSTEILNLATPGQLQLFFDLDWWYKAEMRLEKIAAWLLIIFECSNEAVDTWLKWILQKDIWLIASILNSFIDVIKRPDDMDIQEAKDLLPGFTMDNVYYISFKKPKLAPLFASIIAKILEISPGFYRDVFETILWQTPSHNLETAYRLRCGRLLDHGIPDYYESLDIYLPLKPEQMHRMETSYLQRLPLGDQMPPFVPTLYISNYPLIETAIRKLAGTRGMERIVREITGIANKVMMADLIDMDEPTVLKDALAKTFSILNLGMDYLCEKWAMSPEQILESCFLEEIARVSAGLLLPISSRASEILKRGSSRFLPYVTREQLHAACHRPAMLYDGPDSEEHISSIDQLQRAIQQIEKAWHWITVIECLRPEYTTWDHLVDWKKTNLVAVEELSADVAFCTSACHFLLDEGFKLTALTPNQLPSLKKRLQDIDTTQALENILTIMAPDDQGQKEALRAGGTIDMLRDSLDACFSEIRDIDVERSDNLPFLKTIMVKVS